MAENQTNLTIPFIVHRSKPKALLSIAVMCGFLAMSIAARSLPPDPDESTRMMLARLFTVYVAPPLFGACVVWSIIQFFSKKPVMVIDEDGITLRWPGLIPWRAIAEVRALQVMGSRRYFAVVGRGEEVLAAVFPEPILSKVLWNQRNYGMVNGAIRQSLPMKIETLLEQVGPYCAEKIREH
jgi:hypothetical protein